MATTVFPPDKPFVSTTKKGQEFDASPFFELFAACGRPCWLPVYPTAEYNPGASITNGWPCEYYDRSSIARGEFCAENDSGTGDKVHVVCQERGNDVPNEGTIQNDLGQQSNIWNKIIVPHNQVVMGEINLEPAPDGSGYLAYASDLWLGNTGWHDIPCGKK